MFNSSPDPSFVSLSTSFYQMMLAFYPKRFKQEFGPHMAQVFRDCCLKTYKQSGTQGMFALWALTLFDWFKTVVEEQLNRGTEMTREKFIRLSGWGMILAAISLLLTFLSNAQIEGGLNVVLGAPTTDAGVDRYQSIFNGVRGLPFFFGILLTSLGLVGLHARYGEQVGQPGKIALGVGVLGGVAGLACNIGIAMGLHNLRTTMNFSMAIMFGGMFAFGLVAMRVKPMSRGNILPALAGFWWPFLVIGTTLYHQLAGQGPNVPIWLSFTLFSAMSLFLALLGYALQSDTRGTENIHPLQA